MTLVIFVRYACRCRKTAALRIELFSCNHGINAVLTGFNSTWQKIQVKFYAQIVNLWQKSYLNAIKTRQARKSTVFTNHFAFTLSNLVKCYGFMKTTLFWTLHFSAFTKTTDTINKNKRCHMTFEVLSSICAKLEPVSSKNNEMLEINILQKFTPRALYKVADHIP